MKARIGVEISRTDSRVRVVMDCAIASSAIVAGPRGCRRRGARSRGTGCRTGRGRSARPWLAGLHAVPLFDRQVRQMPVERIRLVAVVHDDEVAVAAEERRRRRPPPRRRRGRAGLRAATAGSRSCDEAGAAPRSLLPNADDDDAVGRPGQRAAERPQRQRRGRAPRVRRPSAPRSPAACAARPAVRRPAARSGRAARRSACTSVACAPSRRPRRPRWPGAPRSRAVELFRARLQRRRARR